LAALQSQIGYGKTRKKGITAEMQIVLCEKETDYITKGWEVGYQKNDEVRLFRVLA
jgi:hypothetical protein